MQKSTEILSDITVYMKYARFLSKENRRETWKEIVERNIKMHIEKFPFLEEEIKKNYQYVFEKKVLPSMRSLQFAGKPIEISPNRIFNCAYLPIDHTDSFSEIMFLLLGGTGVGFSVQKHHIEKLPILMGVIKPKNARERKKRYLIGDSIEGWADSIKILVESYFFGRKEVEFDFRDIRAKGARLITSGGKAPGPQPLKDCLHNITKIFETALEERGSGTKLKSIELHDILCFIADAVLSGGIRRAALISFFSFSDEEMLSCKFGKWYELNPQRGRANNSAVIVRPRVRKRDFFELWEKIKASGSGEPGIFFTNDKDWLSNPCCEISLRANQFCNLTSVNVNDVESQKELNDRIAAAAFIGTLQTSYTSFHYLRDIWQETTEKEALLGVSMTGIASKKVLSLDLKEAAKVAKKINDQAADLISIKKAARITCIKPEGTASLVLGTSSGIHAWHNDYYIRRLRVGKNESIYTYLILNHPELIENEYFKPESQAIISVPIKAPEGAILRDEPAISLLERAKRFSTEWIVNGHRKGSNTHNVSITVSVKDDEWEEIGDWMWENRSFYNGITVIPYNGGSYIQAPHEDCSKEVYERMIKRLKLVDLKNVFENDDNTNLTGELACSGNNCTLT